MKHLRLNGEKNPQKRLPIPKNYPTFATAKQLANNSYGGVAELVECTGLENQRAGNRTGGSNPSFSASFLATF